MFTDRPRRQYVIRSRRCRQRMAQAIGGGRSARDVAGVARIGEDEVRRLLDDESFQELVEHYRRTAELPKDVRLDALHTMALDLMELALRAGDVRVAVFFSYERLHGRDPAMTLAKAVVRKVEAEPKPAPERPRLPAKKSEQAPKREAEFAYCAATQADEDKAAALAEDEARKLKRRVAETGRKLRDEIIKDGERQGTAEVDGMVDSAAVRAREMHGRPVAAMQAAEDWQAWREAFASGQPPAVRHADPADQRAPPVGPRPDVWSAGRMTKPFIADTG